MHQASLLHRRSSSPRSRVWNHNTGYTGAAGIHSEVGSGAHARNSLTERRTSNTLTAEEEIMRKELKKLQADRKHMEKSMLLYSQKMRDISQRKSNNSFRKSPLPFQTPANHQLDINKDLSRQKKKSGSKSSSITSLPSLSSVASKEPSLRDDFSVVSDASSKNTARKQPESRLSMDSGISLDSHRDSSRSSQDPYLSDASKSHTHQSDLHTSNSHNTVSSNGNIENNDILEKRGRAKERKRFRDSKTFKLMPLVDKEIKENEEMQQKDELEEEMQTPRIAPFPDELLQNNLDISNFVLASILECEEQNCVGGSIVGRKNNKNGFGARKGKSKTKYVLFRPKVAQSPSLAALRHRYFRRYGPNSLYFRYSEEVLDALRSHSNSPTRQISSRSISPRKSPCSSPILHGINLDEIMEAHSLRPGGAFKLFMEEEDGDEFFLTKDLIKPPKLSRERSFSAPSLKDSGHSFVSRLGQLDENDDSKLKSVLKRDDGQLSNNSMEKKNVQFFLPDVFGKANVCTSQPAEF